MTFFRRIGKHDLCSEGRKERAFSLQLSNYLFLENGPFLCPFKVTKHYKNWGFSRHRGKPQMALLVAKVPFCVIPKSCVCWEHFLECFQRNTDLQTSKSVTRKKTKLYQIPNIRSCLPKCKKVFFGLFFSVFVLLFCKKAQKGYFPEISEFFLLCSPKRPVFQILLFFLFCYLFWLSFCLPFQNSIFLCLFVHEPLFGIHSNFWVCFIFFSCLSFPNVCLFIWNKLPNIPSFKPKLL